MTLISIHIKARLIALFMLKSYLLHVASPGGNPVLLKYLYAHDWMMCRFWYLLLVINLAVPLYT